MAEPKIKKVKIEPLTDEAFKPFGEVLGPTDHPPDWVNESGVGARFTNFYVEANTRVGIVTYDYHKPPTEHQLIWLEQHHRITEAMIPLDGQPSIVYVAEPSPYGTKPDLDKFKAFLLDGTRGVMLHRLTWHARAAPCMLAVNPPGLTAIMIHEVETWDDVIAQTFELTNRVNLPNDFGLVIQLTW